MICLLFLPIDSFLFRLHLSEQYFTSLQTLAHFLRHVKGLLHTTQVFCGNSDFFINHRAFELELELHFFEMRAAYRESYIRPF